jgi:hypothetical protein
MRFSKIQDRTTTMKIQRRQLISPLDSQPLALFRLQHSLQRRIRNGVAPLLLPYPMPHHCQIFQVPTRPHDFHYLGLRLAQHLLPDPQLRCVNLIPFLIVHLGSIKHMLLPHEPHRHGSLPAQNPSRAIVHRSRLCGHNRLMNLAEYVLVSRLGNEDLWKTRSIYGTALRGLLVMRGEIIRLELLGLRPHKKHSRTLLVIRGEIVRLELLGLQPYKRHSRGLLMMRGEIVRLGLLGLRPHKKDSRGLLVMRGEIVRLELLGLQPHKTHSRGLLQIFPR